MLRARSSPAREVAFQASAGELEQFGRGVQIPICLAGIEVPQVGRQRRDARGGVAVGAVGVKRRSFWLARVARRKGHSFIGYFIFSLFFFPLALLTAYLVHDRSGPAY
jgi:hypothetical protein